MEIDKCTTIWRTFLWHCVFHGLTRRWFSHLLGKNTISFHLIRMHLSECEWFCAGFAIRFDWLKFTIMWQSRIKYLLTHSFSISFISMNIFMNALIFWYHNVLMIPLCLWKMYLRNWPTSAIKTHIHSSYLNAGKVH